MPIQIFWGTLALSLCAISQVIIFVYWSLLLKRLRQTLILQPLGMRSFFLVGATLAVVVFAHTVQVWLWAALFVVLGAINGISDAIYFSLSTYTTLGYGDIILPHEYRIFGSMAAVNGMLSFGLSTAFLVGLLERMFPNHLD